MATCPAMLLSQPAIGQVSAAPNIELPEVTVGQDEPGSKKPVPKPKKAPAAAQQSSTPVNSASEPSGGPRGADKSEIAISPTGETTPVDQIANSVTVITSKEIAARQQRTLPDVLKSVPGLNVVQSNGPGGLTSVFMRGTNSNHVKVLIDGIDVSDPSNSNRSFDYGQLLTADIERVEVLRGPQSGLYGADALGGVIVIYTKKGEGPPKATATVEGGSFGTFNQAAGVRGSSGPVNYAFNVQHFKADETPITPLEILPPGRQRFDNAYENWSYSTKLGVDVSRDFSLNFVARYTDAELDFTGGSIPNAFQSRSEFQQFYSRGEGVWRALDGMVTNYFGINYSDLQSENIANLSAPTTPSFNDGDRIKYDWRSVLEVAPGTTVIVGAEHQIESIKTADLSADEYNSAGFAEFQSEIFKNAFLVANVRYDDNENFGGHETWRVAPAYLIPSTGTKLKASIGTAFKAPTLSQRFQDFPAFFFFGNPDLDPEESIGWDAGFEQALFSGRAQFGATYFHNDITNLIDTNATFSSVENVGRAKTEGVEVFASADITDDIRLRADYTYTEATNELTGEELLRRPRDKASISAGWTPTDKLLLSGSVLYIGEALDVDRVTFANIVLPSYTLVNVAADYKLNGNMSLFGRIDNLFDREYQNPDGFLGTGLGAFVGLRFTN
jgi:vitamin B12 transporter